MKSVILTNNYVPITTISEFNSKLQQIHDDFVGTTYKGHETNHQIVMAFHGLFLECFQSGFFNELLSARVRKLTPGEEIMLDQRNLCIEAVDSKGNVIYDLGKFTKQGPILNDYYNFIGSWTI